jgi:WD repeat-containing protein 76
MATENGTEISDFETQRLANIAERDALLKKLKLESQSAGLFGSLKTPKGSAQKPKKPTPKRVKVESDSPLPRRQSSRLKGIAAESEVAKRKAEEEYEAAKEVERAKKMRRTDSFTAGDMFVAGQKLDGDSLIGVDVITKGVAEPYVRTFGDEDVKKTTDKDLKALREEMSGLKLWETWDPQSMYLPLMDLNARSGTNIGLNYRDQGHAGARLHDDFPPF